MKKIKVEFCLEGPCVREIVSEIRKLLNQGGVFNSIGVFDPTHGKKPIEYNRGCIFGTPNLHPLRQPARGLIGNLIIILRGSDENGQTAESLERLLAEAISYATVMEKIYKTAVSETEKAFSFSPPVLPSKNQLRHTLRNNSSAQSFFRERRPTRRG